MKFFTLSFALALLLTTSSNPGAQADEGASATNRAPASVSGLPATSGKTQEISEELKVNGQSRNLSMGLLFQKDKNKVSFGSPRTDYKDKVNEKATNF